VTLAVGGLMVAAGAWAMLAPASFANVADFPPYNEHFVGDVGAFQFGIGLTMLLALIWRDALALGLTGFVVANSLHAVNHFADVGAGGRGHIDWIGLAALSLAVAVALALRLRELGYVVGEVRGALVAGLEPFVECKTVLLTTYRKDGTPVSAPVSMAVDRDRAFIRTPEKAGKVKRLRNNPVVAIAPSTMRGRVTGPAIRARMHEVHGEDWTYAGHLLRRKHPLLHGVAVPLTHHLFRGTFGRTVHYEVRPNEDAGDDSRR
jgi:PPOX class probable F420-dependent enzyme